MRKIHKKEQCRNTKTILTRLMINFNEVPLVFSFS